MKNKNFIKQAGVLAIAGIICRIIGVIYRRPLTQLIGQEGLGYYSIAYNIYSIILLISSYSIPTAISKEISKALTLREYKRAQRIFYCALLYVTIIGGVASAVTFWGAGFFAEKNAAIVLRVFAPTIFLSGLLGGIRGYFQGHNTLLQTSISQIFEQVFNAIISLLAAHLLIKSVISADSTTLAIYGAVGSAVGTGVGVLSALLFMIVIYYMNRKSIQRKMKQDQRIEVESYKKILKNILFTVTPFILSTALYNLSTILNQEIYLKVLMYMRGFTEKLVSAQYGVFSGEVLVIVNIPIAIATSMSVALLPNISSRYTLGNVKETNNQVDIAIRAIMLIAIASTVGLVIFARPIIWLLFPQEDTIQQATILLRLMSITVVFYSLSTLMNAVLQGIGKINVPVVNTLVALIIQTIVFIVILLTTEWNLYALVVATVLYSFLICLLNGISVRRYLGYQLDIKKTIFIPIVAASIMGAFSAGIYMVINILCKRSTISFLIVMPFAVMIYFITVVKLKGISEREILVLPAGKILVLIFKSIKIL